MKEESAVRTEPGAGLLGGDGDRKGSTMLSQWALGRGP